LIEVYNGRPTGVQAIAASLGEEVDTLEDVIEPYLLQTGLLRRTPQGRQATMAAYDHLGIPRPAMTERAEDEALPFDR
jgi:Holliday junction DNA helicase RuvB